MRDAKLLFHNNASPTGASAEVDAQSSAPGVGCKCNLSASWGGGTATNPVTCTVTSSATAGGTYSTVAVYTIPPEVAAKGGILLSTELPSHVKRYIKTTWAGLAGGKMTDGLDFGLSDGQQATAPFPY